MSSCSSKGRFDPGGDVEGVLVSTSSGDDLHTARELLADVDRDEHDREVAEGDRLGVEAEVRCDPLHLSADRGMDLADGCRCAREPRGEEYIEVAEGSLDFVDVLALDSLGGQVLGRGDVAASEEPPPRHRVELVGPIPDLLVVLLCAFRG